MLVGLIGRPNAGKSTFFKAATLAEVLIANYPFATIKPNSGMAYVKIKDLASEFGKHSNPREGFVKRDWRFVPFELVDVAGLVEGASEGKGLGNEFLNDLSNADALIHVVDVSGETDEEGKPLTENCPPNKDIEMIEKELDLWYFGIFKKVWRPFSKKIEAEKTNFSEAIANQFSGLKVSIGDVKEVVRKSSLDFSKPSQWGEDEMLGFVRELRRISKPMVLAANKVDRPKGKENFEKIKKEFNYPIIPCFAEGELALREADKHGLINYIPGENDFEIVGELKDKQKVALDEIKKSLKEFGDTGVQKILNKVVFDILDYICVYPASVKLTDSQGRVLPDCFLMPPGTTALDFAYKLHSDIGNNFVKAIDLKTKRAVGKEHVLENGDGIEILTR